jgi:anti-anti-sigma factor
MDRIPQQFSFRVSSSGHPTMLEVSGELDLACAGEFAAGVNRELADGPVVLDLRRLTFIDSAGISALDQLLREADAQGQSLTIGAELHENVKRVLEMVGMLDALPLQDLPS